jgi:phenylacetate-CoA ligase
MEAAVSVGRLARSAMNTRALDRLYRRLPVPLQHAAVTAFGWRWKRLRFGGIHGDAVREYASRTALSPEEWRRYQTRELRALLRLAVARVPHYKDAYAGLELTEGQIARFTLEDLPALPPLSKETLRMNPDALVVDGPRAARRLAIHPTSGSTGTPVRTYRAPQDLQRSLALRDVRSCGPAGVSFAQPRATFGGRLVVPRPRAAPPFHRFNRFERQVYFSAFHLSPDHAPHYVEALRRHRVEWMTGYTHCFVELGRMMLEQRLLPPVSLRAIITTSEALTEEGRETIRRAFSCPVYQEYGMVEDVVFACEGPDERMRVSPDAGILELVDASGRAVAPGEPGDVLGTGFTNRSQVLIRYRVGDVGVMDTRPDPSGLGMPILAQIVGRQECLVVGPDGRRSVRFHGLFTELPEVLEAQVIQEAVSRLRIRVVAPGGLSERTAQTIRRRAQDRLTDEVAVDVERVASIPRTEAGKFLAVVSLIDSPPAP